MTQEKKMIKVSELKDERLDYWVAKADKLTPYREDGHKRYWLVDTAEMSMMIIGQKPKTDRPEWRYSPSVNWSQGGPIIERERICVRGPGPMGGPNPEYYWTAYIDTGSYAGGGHNGSGRTPLIAAMRCFVASRFGPEIDDSQAHNL